MKNHSQKDNKQYVLYPIKHNGLWGYVDMYGKYVVTPKYDEAFLFSSGLARVKNKGKYGYIDLIGKQRIKCKYDNASDFINGTALVTLKSKKYNIDAYGKKKKNQVLVFNYHNRCIAPLEVDVSKFSTSKNNKYALLFKAYMSVENNAVRVIDSSGFVFDTIIPINKYCLGLGRNRKFGFYHYYDYLIDTTQYPSMFIDSTTYNFKGRARSWEIELKYDSLVAVRPPGENSSIRELEADYVMFKVGNKWGIMNSFGQEIIESVFYSIRFTGQNRLPIVEFEKDKFGYLDIHRKVEYFVR